MSSSDVWRWTLLEDRIAMSQKERDVLKVMSLVLKGQRTQVEAARLLGISSRQIRRLLKRLREHGDAGVVHRLRGQPSNRCFDPAIKQQALQIYRQEYGDFGPTLAAEKLADRGIALSVDTLHRWLIQAGLWKRQRNRDCHRSRRPRRTCWGELVQADGSHHDWLEGRGPWMVLLVLIDDATSKVMARFYPAETTEGYMDLLGRYLRKWGRMVALYSDRHSIFTGQAEGKAPAQTQVARALKELAIDWIGAHSPQAKGRVERFHGTAQDRLVKELRLAKAATLDQANQVLERTFLPWFNRRCTVKPASGNDAHRPVHPSMHLAAILSLQESRSVNNDYTIRYDNQCYQLLPPVYPGLRGGQVTVQERLDGSRHIRFQEHYLKYRLWQPTYEQAGALPPDPRSLSHQRIPAHQQQDPAGLAAGSGAVHPTIARSGRTPALPCPGNGDIPSTAKTPWRPPPSHPWRKSGHS
jgi:hypothetical protein